MAVVNSRTEVPAAGKKSKRSDLKGTPGLAGSDLQYGDIAKLEQGQKALNKAQPSVSPTQLPEQQAGGPIQAPDPMAFAGSKVGGGQVAIPEQSLTQINTAQWLPLAEKLATSDSASSLLKGAYIKMLARVQIEPFSGSTALVDKNELDRQVQDSF